MENKELVGRKLLVVEDDPGVINLLHTFLTSKGAEVIVLETGRAAVQRIEEAKPDLLILDIVVPYEDGFTILEKLRRSGNATPVILLTDKNSIDDKVKGLVGGADDYMTKPFSTRELIARIQNVFRHLGGGGSIDNQQVVLGDLVIKEHARDVSLSGGESLALTKTEFDLFCYLVKNKEHAVPHATLLSEVMGYRGDIETKALVMHVANIRRKMLNMQVKRVAIETVAGVGYKLTAL